MSLLIELRKRIKAIEVTKKTTNAMRLIAMSAHTRLKETRERLTHYQRELNTVRTKLATLAIQPLNTSLPPHRLVVFVGSQKGLCGNFNTQLAAYALAQERTRAEEKKTLLVIGKQLCDFLKSSALSITMLWPEFGTNTIPVYARELARFVLSGEYTEVTLYATHAQGFFLSRPRSATLLPHDYFSTHALLTGDTELQFEQSYTETWNTLGSMTLITTLELMLLDSFLAEQAARFISMDTATRNADELMVEMKLSYNKLRQSAITRELTDLSGSFM